jgi:hypothetical protein
MKIEPRIMSISLIALVNALTIGASTSYGASPLPTSSHRVGQQIMNFDLTNSTHIFTSTAAGGKLTVVAKTSNPTLIRDIRNHLALVSKGFKVGNYTDPTLIHGASMPGLATLRKDFEKIWLPITREKQEVRSHFSQRQIEISKQFISGLLPN